jgi:hypothetical protein
MAGVNFPMVPAQCHACGTKFMVPGRVFVIAEKLDADGVYFRCPGPRRRKIANWGKGPAPCGALVTMPGIDRMAGTLEFFQVVANPEGAGHGPNMWQVIEYDVGIWKQLLEQGGFDSNVQRVPGGVIVPTEDLTIGFFADKGKISVQQARQAWEAVERMYPTT